MPLSAMPAAMPHPVSWYAGRCTFFRDGLYGLHSVGFKPTVGTRHTHHHKGEPEIQPITLLERGRGVGLDERNAGTIRETCRLMEK